MSYLTKEAYSSLMRDRMIVDLDGREDGEEVRGIEGGETTIRTYYFRKGSIYTLPNLTSGSGT